MTEKLDPGPVVVKTELNDTIDELYSDFDVDIKSEKEDKIGCTDITIVHNDHNIECNKTEFEAYIKEEANRNDMSNISTCTVDLNSHSKRHVNSRRKLNCKFCKKQFCQKSVMENHILKAHPTENYEITCKLHHCELCTFITTLLKEKRRHMFKQHSQVINKATHSENMHYNPTPEAVDGEVGVNIKLEHAEEEITIEYNSIENKIVNDIKKIKEEKQEEIPVQKKKRHVCEYCDYQTHFRRAIKEHMSIHNKDLAELFKCSKCNFTTYYKMSLHTHLKKHGKREKINCTFCNKAFYAKRVLHNHLLKCHPNEHYEITSKVHSCKHCTFKTTVKKEIARHLRNHLPDIQPIHCVILAYDCPCHKSVKEQYFKCSQCEYHSHLVTEFREHLGTHSISGK